MCGRGSWQRDVDCMAALVSMWACGVVAAAVFGRSFSRYAACVTVKSEIFRSAEAVLSR
jgi:hypothetical protein